MLLLVLILVLIAFALLVVALLSSSVLWAWVSVAVSVGAAAALLVDWLQRRAVVQAGARAGVATAPGTATGSSSAGRPVTDVEPATEAIPIVPADREKQNPAFDPAADSQKTVAMPVVQPSGSTDRPSSALDVVSPSGAVISPGVIEADDGDPVGAPSAERSVGRSGAGATAAAGSGGASAGTRDGQPEPPDGGNGARPDRPRADAETVEPAQPEQLSTTGSTVGEEPPGVPAGPAGQPPDVRPSGPSGHPPEEAREAAAAALVADLDDEVVVIDEQPRYHVDGCRSLAGKPVIPLPVKEAVELGFTPCGWCAPDRTLSSRHPAGAR